MELSEDKSNLKIAKRNEEKFRKEAEILQQGMNRYCKLALIILHCMWISHFTDTEFLAHLALAHLMMSFYTVQEM